MERREGQEVGEGLCIYSMVGDVMYLVEGVHHYV